MNLLFKPSLAVSDVHPSSISCHLPLPRGINSHIVSRRQLCHQPSFSKSIFFLKNIVKMRIHYFYPIHLSHGSVIPPPPVVLYRTIPFENQDLQEFFSHSQQKCNIMIQKKVQGNEAFKNGKYQEASDKYTEGIKTDGHNAPLKAKLYYNRALAMSKVSIKL